MPSIGVVGFMVGDDIHLVMWESVGDVIASIMTKEEQHKRKVEQLMKFLQLPLVALLSRAVRNDLRHQFVKQKEQLIGITGR